MAGLGEVCTHVAAVLFYLETASRLNQKATCTQALCQWVVPSFQKDIPYSAVKSLDFVSAKSKKNKIDNALSTSCTLVAEASLKPTCTSALATVHAQTPNCEEIKDFFSKLSACGTKPAILSLVDPYASNYVPKSTLSSFPQPLQELYDEEYSKLIYTELLKACEMVEVVVTEEMAKSVEKETKHQSNCKLWFTYRAGRITASRMKSICRTDPAKPSQSLIKAVCYPEAFKFSTKSTLWGCTHEKEARDTYMRAMTESHMHVDFTVADSGFVINPKWPHIGASPDGLVDCACCGEGVVEIKCPFCHRNDGIQEAAQDKMFCLQKGSDGTYKLDHSHAYYYQVQTQMFVCDVQYCDFVVSTFPNDDDKCKCELHIERIVADDDLWLDCISRCNDFFNICLLPELLGRWYSRSCTREMSIDTAAVTNVNESRQPTCKEDADLSTGIAVYCYCKQPADSDLIGCDNPNCPIEWFHTSCLKIKAIPNGKWYCPDCRKLPKFIVKRGLKRKLSD